jgi:hypothetical protein
MKWGSFIFCLVASRCSLIFLRFVAFYRTRRVGYTVLDWCGTDIGFGAVFVLSTGRLEWYAPLEPSFYGIVDLSLNRLD